MTTTEIVAHSRSIADMAQTKFISSTDEVNFLNEAYRLIYSRYTGTGADFWAIDYVYALTAANLDPNGKGREWNVVLPGNFYQLRGVSYDIGSQWYPMQKVSYSQRNFPPQRPGYRLRNSNLWVLSEQAVTLRIDYYPVPDTLAVDNTEIDYPNAELYEILAYEMALCYLRKQTDQTRIAVYEAKVASLWATLTEIIKQDQYQFERIQNQYLNTNNYGW